MSNKRRPTNFFALKKTENYYEKSGKKVKKESKIGRILKRKNLGDGIKNSAKKGNK